MSDLVPRVLAAIVMILVTGLALWAGGPVFAVLMLLVAAGMAWEWSGLMGGANRTSDAIRVGIVPIALVLLELFGLLLPDSAATLRMLAATLLVLVAGLALGAGVTRRKGFFALLGMLYVALPVWAALVLRAEAGFWPFAWIVLVVIATDSFAFFAGRLIGGPKLAPRISPKKTWAGLIGGVGAAGVLAGLAGGFIGWPGLAAAALAVLLALLAQVGDFFESWLKRRAGIKDSGRLIPGHGGLLDRLDGYVVTLPPFAALVLAAGWA